MTTTSNTTVTYADGWTPVSTGSPSVTVQLLTDGPLLLQVAESEPANDEGFILDVNGDTSFTGNALAATDNVYIKVKGTGQTERVSVMAT